MNYILAVVVLLPAALALRSRRSWQPAHWGPRIAAGLAIICVGVAGYIVSVWDAPWKIVFLAVVFAAIYIVIGLLKTLVCDARDDEGRHAEAMKYS